VPTNRFGVDRLKLVDPTTCNVVLMFLARAISYCLVAEVFRRALKICVSFVLGFLASCVCCSSLFVRRGGRIRPPHNTVKVGVGNREKLFQVNADILKIFTKTIRSHAESAYTILCPCTVIVTR
jgi:hypothetical protein